MKASAFSDAQKTFILKQWADGVPVAEIVRGVQAITTFIEDHVRDSPVDWFWVHKRWPDRVNAALEPL